MDNRLILCKKKRNVRYVNENFFKSWSSKMAYILGFFAADGCLTKNKKRKNYFIEFISVDHYIIRKIKKILKSNHLISTNKNRHKNWKTAYRLQIGSKEIFNDLIHLGFTTNKSLTIKFPKIPEKYLSDFVRGYFDGDGYCIFCTYKRKDRPSLGKSVITGFVSGNKEFLLELKRKLKKYADISGGTLNFHDKAHRLVFSIKDSKKLFNFLYRKNDENLYLKRKFITFNRALKKFNFVGL